MFGFAFLFPGQGSQRVGMGADLAARFPAARKVFERADAALGEELSRLCFEGPAETLQRTENAQTAILACSVAAAAVAGEALEIRPRICLGHSVGEFSALVVAGALELEEALRLVRLRGRAMQAAVPAGAGGMAAILDLAATTGDAEAEAEALCGRVRHGEVLEIANVNGGGQVVVSGHAGAVERLVELGREIERRILPLRVSAPFHCSLMRPAAERLAEALESVEVRTPEVPVVSNVTARPLRSPAAIRQRLVEQVVRPVLWDASVREVVGLGIHEALELGHGRVLSGLVRAMGVPIEVRRLGTAEDVSAWHGESAPP